MLYLMVTRYREINVHPDILHQHKQLTKLSVITDYMKEHYKDEPEMTFEDSYYNEVGLPLMLSEQ